MRAIATASTLALAATTAWTVVLGRGLPDHGETAVILIGVSLWAATATAVVGLLISRGRWARRLAMSVVGAHGVVALIAPVDGWWAGAAVLSAGTAMAVGGPWLNGLIRQRPSASGPPPRAVLVPLALMGVPFAIGVANGEGVLALAVGLTALFSTFWFSRALPGALLVVRALWPVLALGLAWPLGMPAGVVAAILAIVVLALAWDPSVTTAVHPLVERGSVVRIPPELAPREILDAADLDDRGRPR